MGGRGLQDEGRGLRLVEAAGRLLHDAVEELTLDMCMYIYIYIYIYIHTYIYIYIYIYIHTRN